MKNNNFYRLAFYFLLLTFAFSSLQAFAAYDDKSKSDKTKTTQRQPRGRKDTPEKAPKAPDNLKKLALVDFRALRLAIQDMAKDWPGTFANTAKLLRQINAFEKAAPAADENKAKEILAFQKQILLTNPLLDFEDILVVRRGARSPGLGLPSNWLGNCALNKNGFDDQIEFLSLDGKLRTLHKPTEDTFAGDVDLHFDGKKILFSARGSHNRFQVFEMNLDGTGLRQVTPGKDVDIDNFDACYLPDGRIVFTSNRVFQGVPCISGKQRVSNLFIMNADGSGIRQLTFEQDNDWYPSVLHNGRVMYTRWEYTDAAHYFTRILFHMNPDGTNQMALYGSNSYWPNSFFYARPIPNHPTKVVAIISGHHGVKRMGEMIIFDPAKGTREADGVVQRIGDYGKKVEPVIMDRLVDDSWPKFLHPFPLSEKYFLVAAQPDKDSLWGVYLVDVFDNMTLIHEQDGYAMFEPVPVKRSPKPPAIPDKVLPEREDALVYLHDIYMGPGLKDVPKGAVKNLRVFEYHFAYPMMGGHAHIALEGGWDVKRIHGTVPVEEDGSAFFRVPANTPLAIQPLDEEGRAMQIMRSWFTAMPGEVLSCVGCHEEPRTTASTRNAMALAKDPEEIKPFYGPARGYGFEREIQPILDKNCVGCHKGKEGRPDFSRKAEEVKAGSGTFQAAYVAIHPYIYRAGPESDVFISSPMEYHASNSELVMMLKKGHNGVKLTKEEWDKLYTWIDLNVPAKGTWGEYQQIAENFHERRLQLRTAYANCSYDPEDIKKSVKPIEFVKPTPAKKHEVKMVTAQGWPFNAKLAASKQTKKISLGNGVTIDLVYIPAGQFVMGNSKGFYDEGPAHKVTIEKPFWMGVCEVTNQQYNQFDPAHDNRFIDQQHKDHSSPGYPANLPDQPVIRVSWDQASAFCKWLSERIGLNCSLPTEAQWEWACRAGAQTPFYFGDLNDDFSKFENLADLASKQLAVKGVKTTPIANPSPTQAFLPRSDKFDDGQTVVCAVGQYQPNAWGLYDMHGNVSEWTSSKYNSYPYQADDGRNCQVSSHKRVARGGSWRDRPKRATATIRRDFQQWQKVFNVGFRVMIEADVKPQIVKSGLEK